MSDAYAKFAKGNAKAVKDTTQMLPLSVHQKEKERFNKLILAYFFLFNHDFLELLYKKRDKRN